MLFINGNLAYMRCENIVGKEQCVSGISDTFFIQTGAAEYIYDILVNYPKIIIQNTSEHSIKLYNGTVHIPIKLMELVDLQGALIPYADEFVILADITSNADSIEFDLYLLSDFIYKDKIAPGIRAYLLDEILKDL